MSPNDGGAQELDEIQQTAVKVAIAAKARVSGI